MQSFQSGMSEVIYGIAKKKAIDAIHPVKEKLDAEKQNYAKILASTAIGVPNNPFETGGDWKMLTDRWLKKKGASADNPNFYRGLTGDLGEELEGETGDPDLGGETQVIVRDWIWEHDSGFFNPRIKKFIETVFRNEKGQFASKSDFAKNPIQVKIVPFPNLRGGSSIGKTLVNELSISADAKRKLLVNDSLRPLIIPFTDYFFNTRLEKIVADHIRNLK